MASTALLVSAPVRANASTQSPPTPEGWLPHFESMIALAIIFMAVLIALLMNHKHPRKRALGTFLAALACFGVVAWFVGALNTGLIENPKEFQTPMDAAKPALLWVQSIAALVGGFALLLISSRQRRETQELDLSNANEADRYGRVSRILHWTIAILFILMIPMGIFTSMIPRTEWFVTEYNVVHKTIGLILFGLVILRLIWNRLSKRPALHHALKPADRRLAHGAHVLLYVLMIAIPVTGYFMTSFHGYASYFFTVKLAPLVAESDIYMVWGLFHKYLLHYLVYVILGAHILGVLKHHFIDKHKIAIKRMVG